MSPVIIPGDNQRRAADPAASVWVSANAGAGKTRVLTDRVIRILLGQEMVQPGRILCLTFTKAAAAEMKDRLFERLGKWALMPQPDLTAEIEALTGDAPDKSLLVRARRLFALALETPGGLKVQTIHSFCESVLRRFPMEAGIPPEFQVLDEQTAKALFAEALGAAIGNIAASDILRQALGIVAARAGIDTLAGLVAETAKAAQENVLTDLSGNLRRIFGLAAGDTHHSLDDEMQGGMNKPALLRAAAALAQGTKAERDNKAPVLSTFLKGSQPADLAEQYFSLFLTKDKSLRARVTTDDSREADPDCEDIMRVEQARLFDLRQKQLGLALIEDIEALVLFSGVVLNAYREAKLTRGFLDFEDMIAKAADLVTRSDMAAWVLYKLDGGLDHVLVDESQDTSPDQWRVIRGLAEEFYAGEGIGEQSRTMFAVGDEKQSIYSFHGADPEAVAAARSWFAAKAAGAGLPWQEPRLETSFRSTPAVLELVDAVFSEPAVRAGLQEDQSGAIQHRAHRRDRHGLVELWPLEVSDEKPEYDDAWMAPLDLPEENSGALKLARKIAATIRQWLDEGRLLPSRGRPVSADDFLILVRSRNQLFFALARELKRKHIPLAGVDRMVLTDEIAVMDLMALARFALLPEDDLTLAAVLKCPLVDLSEEELFSLAYDRGRESLWSRLGQAANKPPFAAANTFLAEMLNLADQVPPFGFFMHVLEKRGGRRKLLARLGAEVNDPLDEFLTQALNYERRFSPSLQGFLAWMEAGATEIKREQDRVNAGVRLMTVHGAKGLEANIVILPDSCTTPTRKHVPQLVKLPASGADAVVWRKPASGNENPDLVSAVVDSELSRTTEEYRRLLYVAMTRARDWLIICGALNQKQNEPDPGSWYALIEPSMATLGIPCIKGGYRHEVAGTTADRDEVAGPAAEPKPLPGMFRRPPPEEPGPARPLAPSMVGGDEPGPGSGSREGRALALRRGTFIHRLLEFLPDVRPDQWAQAGEALARKYGRELPEDQRREALHETLRLLQHPDFASVFAPGSQAEISLAGLVETLGPRAVSGQIDRLVVTDAQVLIVDYKTSRLAPQTLAEVPRAYLRQMAAYRAALAGIYPGHTIRAALLWTARPVLMEIPEEVLLQVELELKEVALP